MFPDFSPSSNNDPPRDYTPPHVVGSNARGLFTRVLVVEDEWLVAMDIEAVLKEEGFDVVGIATSADEAVRMAELHHPDLVLMDIRIRGPRDGIDAAIELNRRFGTRSLFVSAHRDPATQERAQVANPLGWVSKPFSGQQLIAAIAEATRQG